MTVAEIKKYISEKLNNKPILEIQNYGENEPQKLFTPIEHYCDTLVEIRSMLDELEPKEEWTDIEKSLECLRVEMLNLPTDFDKSVADDHLESLRYIFITQFKENNK